ncbi:MAG: hypothetical protein IPN54_04730 [Bacteroidetes bacterium]|nr:hypothetical protein [Bacteroidota bacterium]
MTVHCLNKKKRSRQFVEVIQNLNDGTSRVAEPQNGTSTINEWIKKAVILYFQLCKWKL